MAGKKKMKIRITDTTLRDAHQSLWATRMRTDDILKIASEIDNAGFYSLDDLDYAIFESSGKLSALKNCEFDNSNPSVPLLSSRKNIFPLLLPIHHSYD